jgi:hypothetical protein
VRLFNIFYEIRVVKTLYLLISFFIVSLFSAAQKTISDDEFFKSLKRITVDPKGIRVDKSTSRYNFLGIIDNRPDTNRLGVYLNRYRKACAVYMDEKLPILFNRFLHDSSSPVKLQLSLEDCWIINTQTVKDPTTEAILRNRAGIFFKAKVYINEGGAYKPLVLIDTAFFSFRYLEDGDESLLRSIIEITSAKIKEALNNPGYSKRSSYTTHQLDSIRANRYQYPIYQVKTYPKGVFNNISDLQQLKPVLVDYRLELMGEEAPYVYTKTNNGAESPTTSIIAISEVDKLWVVYAGQAFQVFRDGRAFYCMGLIGFKESRAPIPIILPLGGGNGVAGLTSATLSIKQVLSPFLLSIEKGSIYQ